ncbi:flagellar biosynthesis anti-sigma factor FlgM [Niallia taxi]|uniref:flagellar biosynthesis anti-sigma factor FlgM n=1 Tax=Niallia taxi TaxID=2499688 RepID=UPI0015F48370|nr:flagellar biosynthesis anti-sigma factor FlgM [Niallia taxi]
MRISNNTFNTVMKAYNNNQKVEKVEGKEKESTMIRKDELHISDEAKAMLENNLQARSSERQAKINRLKEMVASGTYNPDNRAVADAVYYALR